MAAAARPAPEVSSVILSQGHAAVLPVDVGDGGVRGNPLAEPVMYSK
jgi:hypothetical protein